jgi:hypothetical protein
MGWHGGAGTPRALLEVNEVNIYMWKSTPLIGVSVLQMLMQSSFPAN